MDHHAAIIHQLGEVSFAQSHASMLAYTLERDKDSADQIWLLQHPAVYTQGTSCSSLPDGGSDIPVIKTDRGGQITYHGPGQLIIYLLLDIKRLGIGPKALVRAVESAIIASLLELNISADRKPGAPGVYVAGKKIAALGLRIKKGCCYHGLSLNVEMDLSPYDHIDPCGYAGLEVTQIADYLAKPNMNKIAHSLLGHLQSQLPSHLPTQL